MTRRPSGATQFSILLCLTFFLQTFPTQMPFWTESFRIPVTNALMSAAFFTMPFFILPPAWRRTLWLPVVAMTIFLFSNQIYLRIFGDFYHLSSVTFANLGDSMVIDSVTAQFKWYDTLALILPQLLIIPYVRLRKEILSHRYTTRIRVMASMVMALIPPAIYAMAVHHDREYNAMFAPKASIGDAAQQTLARFNHPQYKSYLWGHGSSLLLFGHMLWELLPDMTVLSDSETREIKSMLDGSGRQLEPRYSEAVKANRGKNLILLIVESFNSTLLDVPRSIGACPTIHSLIEEDSAVIFADRIVTQTSSSMSADGQMTYNTGLYPLVKRPSGQSLFTGDMPSLAKALKGHFAAEAICEDRSFYSHSATSRAYGYRRLYYNLGLKDGQKTLDADTHLLDNVIKILPSLPRPFMLEITTLSMHSPYDSPSVSPMLDGDDPSVAALDTRSRNYIEATRCFDNNLRRLLDRLKADGLYDDTVIVIIGDHAAISTYLPEHMRTDCVPMIILNSGISLIRHEPMGQIDVFPTILDVMGADSYVLPQTAMPYRRLGASLLSTAPPQGAVTPDGTPRPTGIDTDSITRRWELAEKMLLGKFFVSL